ARFTAAASLTSSCACSGDATTPMSTTWPAYTSTSTWRESRFGSATNAAFTSAASSRSLETEGRYDTKNVSTRFTPGVERAICTACRAAGEPGGMTPANTTTPCREVTSRLPIPCTGDSSRLALISASISVSLACVVTERSSVATPYPCATTDMAATYGLQPTHNTPTSTSSVSLRIVRDLRGARLLRAREMA